MNEGALCRLLDWDSKFFGMRIGRVQPMQLDEDGVASAQAWGRRESIDCLYFLCEGGAQACHRLVQAAGFDFVDMRVTLASPVPPAAAMPAGIRDWREEDLPALREVAGRSHGDTRFYADGHFARADCDRLYETWIEQSCRGYADFVLVAEGAGGPCGYVTLKCLAGGRAEIGLIAVSESARGQGWGGRLIQAVFHRLATLRAEQVTVVTQGGNTPALRLYQKFGFLVHSVAVWYHWWPARQTP